MLLTDQQKLQILEASFTQSFSSIVITDADFEQGGPHIILCNDSFCKMTGYDRHELIGQNPKILQGPLTDRKVIDRLRQCLIDGDFFHGRATNYRKDGKPYVVEWNITPIKNERGKICYFVSVQTNLSSLLIAERERDILAKALQETSDCVMVTNTSGDVIFVNHGFEKLTGYNSSEIIGKKPFFICSDTSQDVDSEKTTFNLENTSFKQNEVIVRKSDGELAYLIKDVTTVQSQDGLLTSDICIGKDITERVLNRKKLESLAQTDPLTGLLNRHAGDTLIEHVLSESKANHVLFSMVMGDIDHFKKINDQYGHLTGDKVLIAVSALLKKTVRGSDYCVRWGGEEFLIVLPNCSGETAAILAERIRNDLTKLDLEQVGQITMSFGVAQWDQKESAEKPIARADDALYKAKQTGRNRVFMAPAV